MNNPLSNTIIRYAFVILLISTPLLLAIFSNSDPVALTPQNENAKEAVNTLAQQTQDFGYNITTETTQVAQIITKSEESPQIAAISEGANLYDPNNCGNALDGSSWCNGLTLSNCNKGLITQSYCQYGCELGRCLEKHELNIHKRTKLFFQEIIKILSRYVP